MDDAIREQLEANPEPLMVTITTEHFTLATARSQTVAEANGRASIFLAALSSGLVALGFLGPSGTTFEVFALVLFAALAFLGVVTFNRTLQNSIEDMGYALRIDLCRHFYADAWPMLAPYLYRPRAQGEAPEPVRRGDWQLLLTVSGVVAVLTGLLIGSFVGGVVRVAGGPVGISFVAGAAAAAATIGTLHREQRVSFAQADFSRIDPQLHRRVGSP